MKIIKYFTDKEVMYGSYSKKRLQENNIIRTQLEEANCIYELFRLKEISKKQFISGLNTVLRETIELTRAQKEIIGDMGIEPTPNLKAEEQDFNAVVEYLKSMANLTRKPKPIILSRPEIKDFVERHEFFVRTLVEFASCTSKHAIIQSMTREEWQKIYLKHAKELYKEAKSFYSEEELLPLTRSIKLNMDFLEKQVPLLNEWEQKFGKYTGI